MVLLMLLVLVHDTPVACLHVNDDGATGTGICVTGGGSGQSLAKFTRDVSGGTGTIQIHASDSNPQMHFCSASNTYAIGTSGQSFQIADNSKLGTNTRLSIDNTGQVGIGTETPGELLDVVGGNVQVTDGEFIGDLRGAVHFKAEAGEDISEGEAVYISGISGNTTVVSLADADDASKMPAFGIATETATSGNPITVGNFGALAGLNTTQWGAEGDELYIGTTAGQLVSAAPTGESAALQKIAKITRAHASAGSITIMGAGRSNAVPNLDNGDIFIGNGSNQAVTAPLAACICGTGDARYIQGVTTGSYLTGGGLTGCVEVGIDSACASKWDTAAAGDISEVVAGDGLTGGGSSGSVTVDVDSTVVRTSGAQSIAGTKSFTGTICANAGTPSVDAFILTTTDSGADAAPIQSFKRNSGSPADGDYLGQIKFKGEHDGNGEVVYAKITAKTSDVTQGAEDGLIETAVQRNSTQTIVSRQTHDALKLINDTGLEVDGNILSAGSNLNTLFSNCQGTVTSVGVATGLAGTGGTSPTLCIDSTCNTTWNSAYTTTKNLSGCAGLACVGDITSVGTDGTYLTGGATSGGACIGLNIACADKWDNASAGGVTNVTGGDGIDSSGGTTPEITVDSTVVRTTGAQSIAGVKTFTDHVYVNECIVHAGDIDTGMRFNNDGIKLETGGETHLCLSNTGIEVNVANNSNDFRVKTDNVDNSLFVSGSSNNVGAGTDIPNYKLTVANGDFGVANSNKIYVGGATTDSVIGYLGNTSGDLTLQGDGSRDVKIGSGTDPDAIFIKGTTGNVGLGTEAPGQKFVLSGDTGTNIQIQQNDGGGIFLGSSGSTRFGLGTGSNIIQAYTADSDFGIGTQSGNSFTIGTDNNNRLHIKSTGEVGIGTDNPNQKLTVAGTLSAQSCIVGEAIVKRGGTSSQFLKADGSVDSASYTTCIGTVVAGDLVGLDQSSCPGILCTGTVVDSDLDDVNALIGCPGLDCVGDVTGIDAGDGITVIMMMVQQLLQRLQLILQLLEQQVHNPLVVLRLLQSMFV